MRFVSCESSVAHRGLLTAKKTTLTTRQRERVKQKLLELDKGRNPSIDKPGGVRLLYETRKVRHLPVAERGLAGLTPQTAEQLICCTARLGLPTFAAITPPDGW